MDYKTKSAICVIGEILGVIIILVGLIFVYADGKGKKQVIKSTDRVTMDELKLLNVGIISNQVMITKILNNLSNVEDIEEVDE